MSQPKKRTAISLLVFVLLLWATIAIAGQAATVTHVSGPLAARKADGSVKAISLGSKIDEGDTVVTEKRTYARLKFDDGSEVTLKPNSQFKVEKFSYDKAKPKEDAASYKLIKGGLRTITGQIGKRGNQDSYQMKTPTATIGIRGTIYTAEYVPEEEPAVSESGRVHLAALDLGHISTETTMTDATPPGSALPVNLKLLLMAQNTPAAPLVPATGGLAAGLYVHVIDGAINLSNKGGSLSFSAGQFGYTASFVKPPVVVPANPGLKFTPPPTFSSSTVPQSSTGGSNKPQTGDCEVR